MNWIAHTIIAGFLPFLFIVALSGCCTTTMTPRCDPMPKWEPVLEIRP